MTAGLLGLLGLPLRPRVWPRSWPRVWPRSWPRVWPRSWPRFRLWRWPRVRRRLGCAAVVATALAAATLLGAGLWIPLKAELAQYLLERAWTEARAGAVTPRPWPWADTTPVARLSLAALDLSWVVVDGASGRNLAFAPGRVDGSAAPGRPGVMLVAGHRDTHFRALERIRRGMQLELEDAGGAVHRFEVVAVEIVDATRSRLRLDADKAVLVLTTCYPFDDWRPGGPLRYVVTARLQASAGD